MADKDEKKEAKTEDVAEDEVTEENKAEGAATIDTGKVYELGSDEGFPSDQAEEASAQVAADQQAAEEAEVAKQEAAAEAEAEAAEAEAEAEGEKEK